MAIASICHVPVTGGQSEGCIRVSVLVGGVYSCLHERAMAVVTISLLILFCVKTVVVAQTTTRVFVLFVETADKESWEGCPGRIF